MKKPVPIHQASTDGQGNIKFKDKSKFINCLLSLKGDIEIILRPKKKDRTEKQNRYYWAYLAIIQDETGDLADDLHEFLKRKLLPPKFKKILGFETKLPASTADLDPLEFTEYITLIEALTQIPAPNPDEYYLK